VDNTQKAIEGMVKDGKVPPALGRVSQQLNAAGKLARTSVSGAASRPCTAPLPPALPLPAPRRASPRDPACPASGLAALAPACRRSR
jgi:hypothetical protein